MDSRRQKVLGAVALLVLALGILLWRVLGQGDPAQPTASVSAGASPTTRTPDDPDPSKTNFHPPASR